MDAARRRRWIQLGLAAVALAIVVQFVLLPSLNPAAAPVGRRQPGGGGQARPGDRQGRPVEVRLDALTRAAALAGENPAAAQRNPFRMGAATPPPPPPGAAGSASSARPAPPVAAVPAPPAPPTVPPIPYRFIGVLSGAPGQGRIAVLTDGKTVVHGRVSQEIEGRYRIVHIGEESIQIEHLDGRGRQTLRLLGQ
jgi:hypothetical protein